jgi:hypothetical protein
MRWFVALGLWACTKAPLEDPMEQPEVPDGLTTELVAAKGPGFVAFRVTNTSLRDQEYCVFHTPFEGLRNDIFEVWVDGVAVPYTGVMAKRAPPTRADIRELAPHQSSDWVELDLREGYAIGDGAVTARFRGGAISGLPASPTVALP